MPSNLTEEVWPQESQWQTALVDLGEKSGEAALLGIQRWHTA